MHTLSPNGEPWSRFQVPGQASRCWLFVSSASTAGRCLCLCLCLCLSASALHRRSVGTQAQAHASMSPSPSGLDIDNCPSQSPALPASAARISESQARTSSLEIWIRVCQPCIDNLLHHAWIFSGKLRRGDHCACTRTRATRMHRYNTPLEPCAARSHASSSAAGVMFAPRLLTHHTYISMYTHLQYKQARIRALPGASCWKEGWH